MWHIVSPRRALCRAPPTPYRGAPCAVSCLSRDTTQRPNHMLHRDPQGSPQPQYNFVSRLPPARPSAPVVGRIAAFLSTVSQHCSIVSWPSPTVLWPSLPSHAHPVSRYSPLYRDHTRRKWAVAHSSLHCIILFFTLFFFSFQLLENHQYIYFLVNQINFLKFILSIFFSSFTHYKT